MRDGNLLPIVCAVYAGIVLVAITVWSIGRRKRRAFLRAVQFREFDKALEIAAANPRLQKDPRIRYVIAVLEVIAGDEERGIAQLEQLIKDRPKYRLPPIALNNALTHAGRFELGLEAAEVAIRQAPRDPLPRATAALRFDFWGAARCSCSCRTCTRTDSESPWPSWSWPASRWTPENSTKRSGAFPTRFASRRVIQMR